MVEISQGLSVPYAWGLPGATPAPGGRSPAQLPQIGRSGSSNTTSALKRPHAVQVIRPPRIRTRAIGSGPPAFSPARLAPCPSSPCTLKLIPTSLRPSVARGRRWPQAQHDACPRSVQRWCGAGRGPPTPALVRRRAAVRAAARTSIPTWPGARTCQGTSAAAGRGRPRAALPAAGRRRLTSGRSAQASSRAGLLRLPRRAQWSSVCGMPRRVRHEAGPAPASHTESPARRPPVRAAATAWPAAAAA